jgi:hypothetical protein
VTFKPTNLVELVWEVMLYHEQTWVSARVVEDMLQWKDLRSHGGAGLPADQTTFTPQTLVRWFSLKGLLIEGQLAIPPRGAAPDRVTGRHTLPHYYVAPEHVWVALGTAARLGGVDVMGDLVAQSATPYMPRY